MRRRPPARSPEPGRIMNEPELKMDSSEVAEEQDSKTELQALRSLIACALALVIVFTVCVDYYLSAQTSEMGKMLAQEEQALRNFNAYSARAAEFWVKLVDYSKTHSDFNPVIDKWKGSVSIHTNTAPARPK